MGVTTGMDLDTTIDTGRWLGARLGRDLPSALSLAGAFPPGNPDRD
jgi:hydroxymethylglutaryl-CoA lyase